MICAASNVTRTQARCRAARPVAESPMSSVCRRAVISCLHRHCSLRHSSSRNRKMYPLVDGFVLYAYIADGTSPLRY